METSNGSLLDAFAPRLDASVDFRNQLNLNERILRQPRRLDGGASGSDDALRCKVLGVYRVHGGEVVHVFEVDVGLDDAVEGGACSFEHSFQVLESAPGLIGDSAGDELLS